MMTDARDIARELRRQADRLDSMTPGTDWVDAWREGDALGTDESALVAGVSAQTIRRRAAEALDDGRPIGVWIAQSVWLISLRRLLDDIERREGLPGRVAAEARAKKLRMSSPQQKSIPLTAPQHPEPSPNQRANG